MSRDNITLLPVPRKLEHLFRYCQENFRLIQDFINQDTSWVEPALLNNWEDHAATGTYGKLAYRKVRDRVQLSGMITNSTGGSNVVAELPEGFLPSVRKIFTCPTGDTTVSRVDVLPDGELRCFDVTPSFVNLSGISFIAEQ